MSLDIDSPQLRLQEMIYLEQLGKQNAEKHPGHKITLTLNDLSELGYLQNNCPPVAEILPVDFDSVAVRLPEGCVIDAKNLAALFASGNGYTFADEAEKEKAAKDLGANTWGGFLYLGVAKNGVLENEVLLPKKLGGEPLVEFEASGQKFSADYETTMGYINSSLVTPGSVAADIPTPTPSPISDTPVPPIAETPSQAAQTPTEVFQTTPTEIYNYLQGMTPSEPIPSLIPTENLNVPITPVEPDKKFPTALVIGGVVVAVIAGATIKVLNEITKEAHTTAAGHQGVTTTDMESNPTPEFPPEKPPARVKPANTGGRNPKFTIYLPKSSPPDPDIVDRQQGTSGTIYKNPNRR